MTSDSLGLLVVTTATFLLAAAPALVAEVAEAGRLLRLTSDESSALSDTAAAGRC